MDTEVGRKRGGQRQLRVENQKTGQPTTHIVLACLLSPWYDSTNPDITNSGWVDTKGMEQGAARDGYPASPARPGLMDAPETDAPEHCFTVTTFQRPTFDLISLLFLLLSVFPFSSPPSFSSPHYYHYTKEQETLAQEDEAATSNAFSKEANLLSGLRPATSPQSPPNLSPVLICKTSGEKQDS